MQIMRLKKKVFYNKNKSNIELIKWTYLAITRQTVSSLTIIVTHLSDIDFS